MAEGTIKTEAEGNVKITAAIGRGGLKITAGTLMEEYDPDLRGTRGVRIYDEMRKSDPIVAAGIRAFKWVIGQVNWRVEPGGEEKPDEEAAGFLETCMEDMSHTWSDLVQDALTCLAFGWAYMEVIYKLRNGAEGEHSSAYDDGRIGWRKLVLMGHESLFRWETGDEGSIIGLTQSILYRPDGEKEFRNTRTIPIEKAVLFRLDKEKNNPEGVSLLRPVYLPWYKKRQIEEIEAIGIERDLTGVLIIHLPANAKQADYDKAVDLLEQFKADDMTGFVAPQQGAGDHENWRFEIINSPGSKSIEPDKPIKRYQNEIMRSFLAQFLMLGEGSRGSWALARDQRGMFEIALGAIVQSIEQTINRFLIPPLFRFNDFGQLTSLPKIRSGRIGKADMERFTDMLTGLVNVGVITPNRELEEFTRDEMELPKLPEEEEEEKVEPEESGQQEAREFAEVDEAALDVPNPYDDDLERIVDDMLEEDVKAVGNRRGGEALRFQGPTKRMKLNMSRMRNNRAQTFQRQFTDLTRRYREGKIGYNAWASGGKELIQQNVAYGHKIGLAESRGVWPPNAMRLTDADKLRANSMVEKQLKYFSRFRSEVRTQVMAGQPLTGKIDARSRLYAGAVQSSASEAMIGEEPDRMLRWVRHSGDSCDTCLGNAGVEFTAAEWRQIELWPAHNTTCDGNCRCSLEVVGS